MTNEDIIAIIHEAGIVLGQQYDGSILDDRYIIPREYSIDELSEFKRDLIEAANKVRLVFLENHVEQEEILGYINELEIPLIVFRLVEGTMLPSLIYTVKGKTMIMDIGENSPRPFIPEDCDCVMTDSDNRIAFLGVFAYKSLVSDDSEDTDDPVEFTPVQRLFKLLSEEKKDIFNILVFAVFIGLIGLTLPLGIQATVELVSGGVVVSSVYILIAFVILGVLIAGALQVMQITIVEFIQRRIFTKAALEFAFRVPRIKIESIISHHAPELINRFFDVLTLQKGIPKLLIDLSAGVIQIFFGLLLLSFYHPFFVFFGIILVGILVLIFYITGPKGLRSSIMESKYKYKVVYWLEEIARTINSFKISGNSLLPVKKTEYNVNNYLKHRRTHFRILVTQYTYILLFKAVVTGGLLIIGTTLVIQREITLGQFVASEVIIILILSSVEKIILYMEVIYDLLTAVDKIAHVTDLPMEKRGGFDMPHSFVHDGFSIEIKNLNYAYPEASSKALVDIDLTVESGEKVCISGSSNSGKSSLINTISGLNSSYEGSIMINDFSLRDLDITHLRDMIGKNVSQEDIFDGTILENILVGKPHTNIERALESIQVVGLKEKISTLPEGINTHMLSGGKGFSTSFVNRLILARCLAKHPKLLILNDFFMSFSRREKLDLIHDLSENSKGMTIIIVSNDPVIMSSCDQVVWMEDGKVIKKAPYEELIKDVTIKDTVTG